MSKGRYLFTSESVTEGHPDKIADQISDSILDAILAQDPVGRVACETLVTTGLAIVAGEITTSCYVDFPSIVRETIREVGHAGRFGDQLGVFDPEPGEILPRVQPALELCELFLQHGQEPRILGQIGRGAPASEHDALGSEHLVEAPSHE